jgi:hypothetical protein
MLGIKLPSERLFVGVAGVGCRGWGRLRRSLLAGLGAGRPSRLLDLGLGPAQARPDLVSDDLDLGPLGPVLGVPRALLQSAVDDGAGALVQGGGGVLAERPPGDDVEERRLFLPLAVGLVAPVDGQPEAGDAAAPVV